jgi:histidinol-phosphate aminotransferase
MVRTKPSVESIPPYIPGVLKPGAIKLASNENPLGTSPKALDAIRKAVRHSSLYPDGGCVELKAKLAAKFGLEPANFVVGNGSDEIFVFAAALTVEPGDNMVTSECTFSEYAFAARLFGGTPVYAPMRDGKIQLSDILARIDGRTRMVCVANPNNPTGTYVTDAELRAFLSKVPDGVMVLLDEAYREYVEASDYPDSLALLREYPNLFITRTFSKIYGLAGSRLGYGIGRPELIASLNKARTPFNVNLIAQAAGIAALDDGAFVAKSRQVNAAGKLQLAEGFQSLSLGFFPTQGNFYYVKLGRDCQVAFRELAELGVTIRPLTSFGVNDAIRVTVGTEKQNRFFLDCLGKYLGK